MYWCKSKSFSTAVAGLLLISGLQSCKPDVKETGANMKYFDIQGFFKGESARLSKSNKPIIKTIKHNGVTESKKVLISNWTNELSLFSGSDINKPSWRDSYSIQADSNITIYLAKDPDLKTRELLIKKANGKVKYIMIINYTKKVFLNRQLYKVEEKLSYFPDSLYLIQRAQTMKLLGTNKYDISGNLN